MPNVTNVSNVSNYPRVAVIGAGIAGLACAAALQSALCQVSIFDKSRGPGGRMSTRQGDGWQCDHGAQYFTARDSGFRAEVARWEQAGVAAQWRPEMRRFDADGAWARCGAAERFVGTPSMTAPAAWLASTLTLRTDAAISALQREQAGWRLHLQSGEALDRHFDAVVLALPAPQAAPLLRDVAPLLAALAAGATMQGCWAMMLQYPAPLALGFDAAFVNRGALRWVARDSAKPGRSGSGSGSGSGSDSDSGGETWLLHASAAWSEAHIEHDAASIAALLLPEFAQLGGAAPEHWSAHRWRYASTVQQTQAQAQAQAQAHDETCSWDGAQALGLCGDWLNGGTVEAAWLSGHALAQRMCALAGAGGMSTARTYQGSSAPL